MGGRYQIELTLKLKGCATPF